MGFSVIKHVGIFHMNHSLPEFYKELYLYLISLPEPKALVELLYSNINILIVLTGRQSVPVFRQIILNGIRVESTAPCCMIRI